jgi:hypothetical protein
MDIQLRPRRKRELRADPSTVAWAPAAGSSSTTSTPSSSLPPPAAPRVAGGGTWIGGALKHGGAYHAQPAAAPPYSIVRWALAICSTKELASPQPCPSSMGGCFEAAFSRARGCCDSDYPKQGPSFHGQSA